MSDKILDIPERLNFLKLIIVVLDIAAVLTRKIMEIHLYNKKISLRTFITENQHDIYHFFEDKRKCCLCPSKGTLISEKVLKEPQMKMIFDKSQPRKKGHNRNHDDKWCCCEVNAIKIEDLDLSFLRFFLLNFCDESLWDIDLTDTNESFQEILNHNKHDIYHLLNIKITCCKCNSKYVNPKSFTKLDSRDFFTMFALKRQECHQYCICAYEAEIGLTHTDLRGKCNKCTFKQLTRSFCNIRKTIEKVVKVRNDIAHVYGKTARVSDDTFKQEWSILRTCMHDMGKVTGTEEWTNKQMDNAETCQFNGQLHETMYLKLMQETDRYEVCYKFNINRIKDIFIKQTNIGNNKIEFFIIYLFYFNIDRSQLFLIVIENV